MNQLANVSKYLFALIIGMFGTQHYIYAVFVATIVPQWIPFHLFWTYFTGAAMIAVAVSIFINKKVKLACCLLGIMIWIFIFTVHSHILIESHFAAGNITNAGKDICIASCAFIISASEKQSKTQ
ncbi:MAG TPA: hypothetical protein VGN20_23605 [Mucilaginibacter sp.]|jgi:uncharacterized membrane protein